MTTYEFDVVMTATVQVSASSREEAAERIRMVQGARPEVMVGHWDGPQNVELREVSYGNKFNAIYSGPDVIEDGMVFIDEYADHD